MREGKTGYSPHGIPQLRRRWRPRSIPTASTTRRERAGSPAASRSSRSSRPRNPGDEVLYPTLGSIYESQIESTAASPPYGFIPGEKNFLLDFEAIEAAITPRHAC
jgi:hypothetical protein